MKFDMETQHLPPNRPKSWRKHTVIIASTAIVCILITILFVRLKQTGPPVIKGTCGGLLEGNNGSLNFVKEPKEDDAGTSSLPCLWTIQLSNETNIRFTLNALDEDAYLNLCSGDQLASCSSSSYTIRLNSTEVGSSFEFFGKTLVVVLPSSSASVAFSWNFLTTEIQNLTNSQGIVEGIIAGTDDGVVIIPLDSPDQRTIASTYTTGVAFNWQSRKVYWVQGESEIKISNLDGSSAELVISDTSELFGLAVDQVTGNFYYGLVGSHPRIQVCDSTGKKCATVVSMVNNVRSYIYDIAVFPSEGLMFWSSSSYERIVTRANMDGTNSVVIFLEHIDGLFLHEFEKKLYWANYGNKIIGHRDLDGFSRNVLINTTMYPSDIAVDGDTLYFGGQYPHGVYSVTGNRTVSTIANTAGQVYHIALYGRNKVPSRQNSCENSPCVNLCVLNRDSYSCL